MKCINLMQVVKIATAILLFSSVSAHAANWRVDNQNSLVSFISTKKINIAEVNHFKSLHGALDSLGNFELNIDLASVDTNIPVRDERMTKYLFEVESFSTAKLKAKVDLSELEAIAQGASAQMKVDAELDFHGKSQPLTLNVIVTRLVGAKLSVVSVQPVVIQAEDFALVAGVNKLMELAKLPSISHAVPVSFYLTLNLEP